MRARRIVYLANDLGKFSFNIGGSRHARLVTTRANNSQLLRSQSCEEFGGTRGVGTERWNGRDGGGGWDREDRRDRCTGPNRPLNSSGV
jgi:hypothetical protein